MLEIECSCLLWTGGYVDHSRNLFHYVLYFVFRGSYSRVHYLFKWLVYNVFLMCLLRSSQIHAVLSPTNTILQHSVQHAAKYLLKRMKRVHHSAHYITDQNIIAYYYLTDVFYCYFIQ